MKKLVLFFAVVMGVAFFSCGNQKAEAEAAKADSIRIADSIAQADSIAAAEAAAAALEACTDTCGVDSCAEATK